jgi:2-octaprenyl-6-methoxyphenol hydroxylase
MTRSIGPNDLSVPTALPPFDIIIAGAGFAGLALAHALGCGLGPRARIAVVALKTPVSVGSPGASGSPGSGGQLDGRAVSLAASSVRFLRAIGVWDALAGDAQPVVAIDITDSALKAGLRPVLMSYDNEVEPGEPAAFIVPNARLEAVLADGLARRPEVTVIAGAAVTGFEARDDGIDVVLADGRQLSAKLLAATDGRRSRVRELAGIGTVGWAYRQHGITVTIGHERPHEGRAVQHFLPGGPFAMLPMRGNRTCITWSEGEAAARTMMAMPEPEFLAELDRRVGGRLGTLWLDGPRQSWPLEMFLARAFVAPRLALVGDAAHNVHPIAGQGLNLGLKDVAALTETIVDAHRAGLDIGRPETLTRYERWRRFDTLTAAASFDALNRLFSNDVGLLRSLRSAGLEAIDRLPFLKRMLVAEASGTTGAVPRSLRGERI